VKPHEIIRLAQLGARQELLSSRFIWECTSCGTCAARCPQGVDLPAAIDALRRLSRDGGFVAEPAVAIFNDIFLDTVRQLGRVHELALMAAFKLRTRRLAQDVGKLPMMLRKGKFALMPRLVPGRAERQRLFHRARKQEEETP
jgi:heterodisulfide reductase subunit C